MCLPLVLRQLRNALFGYPKSKQLIRSSTLRLENLEDRSVPAAVASILGLPGLGSVQPLIGTTASYNFNFTNTGDATGYSPYIVVALDTSGVDGTTSLPTDGFGLPSVSSTGLPLTPVGAPIVLTAGQTTFFNPFTQRTENVPAGFGTLDTITVYRLPFGSFTPGQTTAMALSASTSNLADANVPLAIHITPGFLSASPLLTAPVLVGSPVVTDATPVLYRLTKTYNGPENETATGPNFVRSFTISAAIAPGQVINNFQITDTLANSMQYVSRGANTATTSAGSIPFSNTGTALTTVPGGTVRQVFGTVTGTGNVGDATLTFEFYVPRDRSTGSAVLPQSTTPGSSTDSVTDPNSASSSGNWLPIDPRDRSGGNGTLPVSANSNTVLLQEQSIATQKSVEVFGTRSGGPAGVVQPGLTILRHTIRFQVSDYYAFQNITLQDLIGDGQRLYLGESGTGLGADTAFLPTLQVNNLFVPGSPGSRTSTTGGFVGTGTIQYRRLFTSGNPSAPLFSDPIGYSPNGPQAGNAVFTNLTPIALPSSNPYSGNTFLQFNLSAELQARNSAWGRLVGGDIGNNGSGPFNNPLGSQLFGGTQGTITYYTLVSQAYSDAAPGVISPVNQGDNMANRVPLDSSAAAVAAGGPFTGITGQQIAINQINAATPTVIGTGMDDTAGGIDLPFGTVTKQVHAINATLIPPQGPGAPAFSVQAGDLVTYKLTYTLPITSFQQLTITDLPPLPIFPVGVASDYTFVRGAPSFVDREIAIAPDDTFFSTFGPGNPSNPQYPNLIPGVSITTDTNANSISLNFGSFEDRPLYRASTISLLITLRVGAQPFSENLFLTNQVRVVENVGRGTNSVKGLQNIEDIRRFEMVRPQLLLQKGAVAAGATGLSIGSGANLITFAPANNPSGTLTLGGNPLSSSNSISDSSHANAIGSLNITPSNIPVQAGDRVRYAIVAQNNDKGDAYNITISDQLPTGYVIPATAAGLNLRVFRGNGALLTAGSDYTLTYNAATGRFTIVLSDNYTSGNLNPSTLAPDTRNGALSRGLAARVDGSGDVAITNGSNTVIILYDAQLARTSDPNTVAANQILINTAAVTVYAAASGPINNNSSSLTFNPDLTDPSVTPGGSDPTDSASVLIISSTINKSLLGTSINETNNTNTQAVIGELASYRLLVGIPQGITPGASVIDTLPNGLAFVSVQGVSFVDASGNPTTGLSSANVLGTGTSPANVNIQNNGRTITFQTGTLSNSNTDNAPRFLQIDFQTVVLNVGSNTHNSTVTNTARVTFTGEPATPIQTTNNTLRVIEPRLTVNKSVTLNGQTNPGQTPVGQFGDAITFGFVIAPTAGRPTAYNSTFSDPLPTAFASGSIIANPTFANVAITGNPLVRDGVNPAVVLTSAQFANYFEIVGNLAAGYTVQTRSGVSFSLVEGQSISFQIVGTVSQNAITNTSVSNTATVLWQSMDAVTLAQQGPFSSYNNSSYERTGNTSQVGGTNNTYRATSTATFDVLPFVPTKLIVTTSEAATPETGGTAANPRPVSLGEIVRYRVFVQIAQGTTPDLRVVDTLTAGLSFLGNVRVATVSSTTGGTLTSSLGTVFNVNNAASPALDPGLLTGPNSVPSNLGWTDLSTLTTVPTVGSTGTLTFTLGTLTNTDQDPNRPEYLVLEYNALVRNIASNATGTQLNNSFQVNVSGTPSGPVSNTASVQVVEPRIVVSKTVQNITAGSVAGNSVTGDAGDLIRYIVTLNSNGNSTAFNTLLNDALPIQLEGAAITAVTGGGLGLADFTITAGILQTALASGVTITSGSTVSITVEGTLAQSVAPTQQIGNTANVTWTSLPGSGSATADQPGAGTGQITPGASGTPTGERNGSGTAPNTYSGNASANIVIPGASLTKTLFSTSLGGTVGNNLAIGEVGTYELAVTLPEGTASPLVITDTLPAGMTFVAGSVVVNTSTFNGTTSAEQVTYNASTRVLTITFPSPGVVTVADNNATNNVLRVRYNARVLNVPGNTGISTQTTLQNTATLTAGPLAPPVSSNSVVATVVEPRLQVVKTLVNADTSVDAGTTMNYQLVIRHTGASTGPAYHLRVNDALASIGLSNVANVTVNAPGYSSVSNNSTSGALELIIDELRLGDSITVTYSATLNGPGAAPAVVPTPGSSVVNTATVNYQSAPIGTPESRNADPINSSATFTVNTYSISGVTFNDRNNNGIRDVGESLIVGQNITYRLIGIDAQGNAVDLSQTTSNGQYSFTGIRPGNYRVLQVNQPTSFLDGIDTSGGLLAGQAQPFGGSGADPIAGGKTDPGGAVSGNIGGSIVNIVVSGNAPQDGVANAGVQYNFGELVPATLGDRVWLDQNGDGIQQGSEPGIPGIEVTLTGTDTFGPITPRTVTTNGSGNYSFGDLRPGTYRVTFGNSDGTNTYLRTFPNIGGILTGTNSTPDRTTGQTGDIVLNVGQNQNAVDQGLFLPVTVGDRVWYDVNNNGLQDTGEPGLPSVSVQLSGTDGAGNPITLTATTNADGNYQFTGLAPGTYSVSIGSAQLTALANLGFAPSTATSQATSPVQLLSGSVDNNRDFGFTGTGSLGSVVWYDLTRNGLQDNNEPGIAAVNLTVVGTIPGLPNSVSWALTTDANGRYSLTNLPFGSYTVTVDNSTLPAGVRVNTYDFNNGTTNPTDTASTTLTQTTPNNPNVNFGYTGNGLLGDRIWLDQNGDGIQDTNEPGLQGIQVRLTWAGPDNNLATVGDNVILSTTTETNGLYTFDRLPPGVYRVEVLSASVPAGLVSSGNPLGGSNGANTTSLTVDVQTGTVQTRLDQDFGYRGNGSLSGTIYLDADNNGERNAGEPGISGTLITLTGTDIFGNRHVNPLTGLPFTTLTDSNGLYFFPNLPPGVYTITESQPAVWAQGTNTIGTIAGSPQGTLVPVDQQAAIPVGSGQNGINYNFGEVGGRIAGTVWLDRDQDGIIDANEPRLEGVLLTLQTSTGQPFINLLTGQPYTTTTNSLGEYVFVNLPAGSYQVVQTQPLGYGNSPATPAVIRGGLNLDPGQQINGQDFGETLGSIAGVVYLDQNRNGVRDSGEPGLTGVLITLSGFDVNGNPVNRTTTTGTNGNFLFGDLLASDSAGYTLTESQPAGYLQGSNAVGTLGGSITADVISGILLPADGNGINYLFGEQLPLTTSLLGTVYLDRNRDGVLDVNEPGLGAVTIRLLDVQGSILQTTTTNPDGTYSFTGLTPGVYSVQQVQPGGYGNSTPTTLRVTVPASGLTNLNFGNTLASLSGTVYLDGNSNNVRDTGEPGIPGTGLTLTGTDVNGVSVNRNTVTDANGRYLFDDLLAGTYVIVETQPAGYNQGTNTVGSVGGLLGPGIDTISAIPLGAGVVATGYDFGERGTQLTGIVWLDTNRNGQLDSGEVRLQGVVVRLLDASGQPVLNPLTATEFVVTTDASGVYTFSNIPAGNYVVLETPPPGYGLTPVGPFNTISRNVSVPLSGASNQNFGHVLGSLAGNVYVDTNNNSVRDPGEPGIPGTLLTLTGIDVSGNPISRTTTTDANGTYRFVDLLASDLNGYRISETQPIGYGQGINAVGTIAGIPIGLIGPGVDQLDAIILAAGAQGVDYNFGERVQTDLGTTIIQGVVYLDSNRNSNLDGGESGTLFGNLLVELRDSANNVINSVRTNPDGSYVFPNVGPGTYSVVLVSPLPGYGRTENSSGEVSVTVPTSLSPQTSIHFGLTVNTLSGTVYVDQNDNGVFDSGDTPLPGVTITLTGTNLAGELINQIATTDAQGRYLFTDLLAADASGYTLTQTQPAGYQNRSTNVGTITGQTSGTFGQTQPDTATTSQITGIQLGVSANGILSTDGINYNFGELPVVPALGTSVAGISFFDRNGNGQLEVGELGLNGVTVRLLDASGQLIATTTTLPDGSYLFPDVPPGSYTIEEVQPDGYGNPNGGVFAPNRRPINVSTTPLTNQNFANTLGSLAGAVYLDANGNGQRDFGEVGLAGVQVTLLGTTVTGTPVVRSTTTNGSGAFFFSDLLAGTYSLIETQPAGYRTGVDTLGNLGGATLVPNVFSGISLAAGQSGTNYLFAELLPELPPGQTFVAGVVWLDRNQDAAINSTESGLAGITVQLVQGSTGTVIATTTTRSDGSYVFPGIQPGEYRIATPDQPTLTEYSSTTPTLLTVTVPGSGLPNQNFGKSLGSLSGQVYFDQNNNGIRDPGEPGISGTILVLTGTDAAGNQVNRTTTTGADGTYFFADLRASDSQGYTITETQPTGFSQGTNVVGSAGGTVVGDSISGIVLAAGSTASGYNFGEIVSPGLPGTTFLAGTVFVDANKNGVLDPGETGMSGVSLQLLDRLGNPVGTSIITNADGTFFINGITPGNYTLVETQPVGYGSSTPNQLAVTVLSTGLTGQNFGNTLGALSGFVYIDRNNDGRKQNGERGLEGVLLTLEDVATGAAVATTITAADGSYRFNDLLAGTYRVVETQPITYAPGLATQGSAGGNPINPPGNVIDNIALGAGTDVVDYLFGELAGSISGSVYNDLNNNGFREPNEPGIAGVLLTLTGTDSAGNALNRTTRTDSLGNFLFEDLPAGNFALRETQPSGFLDGQELNLDPNLPAPKVGNDVFSNLSLAPGQDRGPFLFGELGMNASLSGSVYFDLNRDTFRNPGEIGIPGVTVLLTGIDILGRPVRATVVTDRQGNFVFERMFPGTYTLRQVQDRRYLYGSERAGSLGGNTATSIISNINVGVNESGVAYLFGQFGFRSAAIGKAMFLNLSNPARYMGRPGTGITVVNQFPQLSGFAFLDTNDNGVRDSGEAGVGRVVVVLTGRTTAGRAVRQRLVTDTTGYFSFSNLAPGTYSITRTLPAALRLRTGQVVAAGTAGGTSLGTSFTDILVTPTTFGLNYDFALVRRS